MTTNGYGVSFGVIKHPNIDWLQRDSLVAQMVKRLPAMWATRIRSPGQEDSPGEGNGNPLQYSCLENSMDGRILVGYSSWGHKELDTTERLHFLSFLSDKTIFRASQVALVVKKSPATAGDTEMQFQSLGQEDPLEKGMTTHSSILAWRIPRTEVPGEATDHGVAKNWIQLK